VILTVMFSGVPSGAPLFLFYNLIFILVLVQGKLMSHYKHSITITLQGNVWNSSETTEQDSITYIESITNIKDLLKMSDPRNLFNELISISVDSTVLEDEE